MKVWVSAAMPPDLLHRVNKAVVHVNTSRSELIRLALTKYLKDHGLWSLRGPERTGGKQRPPIVTHDDLRKEVDEHDER